MHDKFRSKATRGQWSLLLISIGVLAFGFRYFYVLHAQVQQPRGDAVAYYAYATNLVRHGVFTIAHQGVSPIVGDSFRDPGYPLFLAAWMKVFSQWDQWYAAVLLSQSLLSALTVVCVVVLARRWMPFRWLAAAGVLMALWPHNVTMSGYLLSETLFGFLCAAGMMTLSVGLGRHSVAWVACSGAILALSALTNAVLLPFAILLALYLLIRRQVGIKMFAGLAIAALAVTIPWSIRNASLPAGGTSSSQRAMLNLVQGSWPDMHYAYQARANDDPSAKAFMAPINQEAALLESDTSAGLGHMAHRMASQPGMYLRWYLGKPVLLWGWSIRVGQGDIYVFPTRNSPFETDALYRIVAALCRAINPWLLLLAVMGGVLALLPKQREPAEMASTSLLLIFVTAVYSVLQAEPRYSIPFRGFEIALGVFAIWRISKVVARLRSAGKAPIPAATHVEGDKNDVELAQT